MALFKPVSLGHNSDNPNLIKNQIKYILRADKKVTYWDGYNFVMNDVESIIEQFYAVRKVYRRFNGIQMRHFVLSFSDYYEGYLNGYQAYMIGKLISQVFCEHYQIIFAVHEKPKQLHIHFLVNTVDIHDGSLFDLNKYTLQVIWSHVEFILRCPYLWGGTKKIKLYSPDDW